jgi:hypothetical protein
MDWHFPCLTAFIIQQFVIFQRRLLPPNLQLMANSNLVYHVIHEQNQLTQRAFGRIILVEDLTDEEDTVIEDNDS